MRDGNIKSIKFYPTVIMDKRLDQLATVQFIVTVGVVHLEVVEL